MDFDETRLYYSHQQLQVVRNDTEGNDVENGNHDDDSDDKEAADLNAVRRHFREFLRNYQRGRHGYIYREKLLRMHRRLSRNVVDAALNHNSARLEVDVADIGEYDPAMLGFIRDQPATLLPALEAAASDALNTLLYDLEDPTRSNNNHDNDDNDVDNNANDDTNRSNNNNSKQNKSQIQIQVLFKGNLALTPIRSIKSEHMNHLLKCPGIIISASPARCRATQVLVRCSGCQDTQRIPSTEGPFGTVALPQRCLGANPDECGSTPYSVVPDDSQFVDRQTLKLQEAPEKVPTGEMPRAVLLAVERSLVDKAPPGTRVSVFCIPTLFNAGKDAVRTMYLRVVGLTKENENGDTAQFTPAEEEAFSRLSRRRDVYEILARSVAPSISGSYTVDIKRALVCMMLGGTRKRLPDGVRLRGDINVLLLGDPSTAKSQFLKFVSKVAPVAIYTSGKGSSAAGLTASVVKDAKGEFYLEGGAMVLADGGIVCIDEFDKMRATDRVAIHEAMEQQTISIAKAGITTVLNSRSAVLAAANPVFGRYDDFKSAAENIDLMTTILSRFDLIFLVRDVREEERDRMICRHVMGVHINNSKGSGVGNSSRPDGGDDALAFLSTVTGIQDDDEAENQNNTAINPSDSAEAIVENVMRVATTGVGELDVPSMKKYIQYCRTKCSPTLSEESGEVLMNAYVKIRDDVGKELRQHGAGAESQAVIPITVRQLEALVRVSESLARTRLDSEVRVEDVNEALRLFRVSTMEANAAGRKDETSLLSTAANREDLDRTQQFLRSRLNVGSMVNKQRLVEEAAGQGYSAMIVARVLAAMVMRGEVLERNQGRLIKRIK